MVVRLGIPPLDIIPGFQGKFLSDGMTVWAWTSPADASIKIASVQTPNLLGIIAFPLN
jgi:hypothetical protein